MPEQCDGCKFMRTRVYGDKTVLECRGDFPRGPITYASWPQVKPDDWCGRWEAAAPATMSVAEYPADHPVQGDLGSVPA